MWILIFGCSGMFVTVLGYIVFTGGWGLMSFSSQAPDSVHAELASMVLFGAIIGALVGSLIEYRKAKSGLWRKIQLFFIFVTIFCVLFAYYGKQFYDSYQKQVKNQKQSVAMEAGMIVDGSTGNLAYGFIRHIDRQKTEVSLAIDREGNFYLFEEYGIFALTIGHFSAPVLKFDSRGNLDRNFSLKLLSGLPPNERTKGMYIQVLKDNHLLADKGFGLAYVIQTDGTIVKEFKHVGPTGQIDDEWKAKLMTDSPPDINDHVRARIMALGGYQRLVVLPDGGVVMAGNFVAEEAGYRSDGIVKILPSGHIDTTFLVDVTKNSQLP